jgi:cytoskeletal protein CcmA (bactofilin family)
MKDDTTRPATSLISRRATIEGDILGNESLAIEGVVKGSVKLSGNIVVETSGNVEADLEAENVVIRGRVRGYVMARQHLVIAPSGKLIGDFAARSVDIQQGAHFEGRSQMLAASPNASTSADKPATA